jgi:hypothetical protein
VSAFSLRELLENLSISVSAVLYNGFLLFLWGEPYYTAGEASRYAHWYYLGSSFGLANYSNQDYYSGNGVDVYLVAGQVTGWVDYIPSDIPRRRRIP